jgi:Short C-terminal domain
MAIVVVASVIAFLAVFAVWANRQALETDTWTDTSTKLLEDEDIRSAVAGFLVDELYANVDVQARLEQDLPPQAQALAGPVAGGLRELAERTAVEALGRPRVQGLWEEANRRAHEKLLDVIENKGPDVASLDLGSILDQAAAQSGLGGNLTARLPPDVAQIDIIKGDQIEFAQAIVRLLRALAIGLTALALALYALAIYLARGWRREALRGVGVALVLVGVAVLVARGLAGGAVVDALTTTAGVEAAANSTWEIGTSLLRAGAVAMIGYGIVIVLGAWLAGPTRQATGLRRGLAPYLRERPTAYAGVAAIVLLVLWWNPTPGTSRLLPTLILIALFVAGVEALRRLTIEQFPGAERGHLGEALAGLLPTRRRAAANGGSGEAGEGERLQQLERLSELRAAGVLTEEELAAEKRRILSD